MQIFNCHQNNNSSLGLRRPQAGVGGYLQFIAQRREAKHFKQKPRISGMLSPQHWFFYALLKSHARALAYAKGHTNLCLLQASSPHTQSPQIQYNRYLCLLAAGGQRSHLSLTGSNTTTTLGKSPGKANLQRQNNSVLLFYSADSIKIFLEERKEKQWFLSQNNMQNLLKLQ